MGYSAFSWGSFFSSRMALSCFPAAREKSKDSGVMQSESQCISCRGQRKKATVIVGGGVCGMSTAYWHSRMRKTQKHKIVILEARAQCFQGASGYNSGLLSSHWFSGDLRLLADHSFDIYKDLARKQVGFKTTSGYHDNSLFQAHCGKGLTDPRAPGWINVADGWHLEAEPPPPPPGSPYKGRGSKSVLDNPSSAIINPKSLGKWLYDRCLKYGVYIRTECRIVRVRLCACGKLRSVTVKSVNDVLEYECDNLVFAAGTRTPHLVRDLFPKFDRDFHETINSGNWIIVKSRTTTKQQMPAEVILDDVVNHQLEFVGREDQNTKDFVFWVCGLNDQTTKLGSIDDQTKPNEDAVKRLQKYAAQFLWNEEAAHQEDPEILEKGRTYRPTLDRELPILTSLSCNDLIGSRTSKHWSGRSQKGVRKSGVWVCTGHGKYGMTLGMGSGKLMSQMILGKKTDLDVTKLGFGP